MNVSKITSRISTGKLLLWSGVGLEIIVWWSSGASWLSGVSGVLGMISVVLFSQRRLLSYLPGLLQLGSYLILSLQARLYGEVLENVFYLITMGLGLIWWGQNSKSGITKTRELGRWPARLISALCALGVFGLWRFLETTDDPLPILDSLSTVPAIVAQFLMISRYRESWIYWGIIDVTSIFMWWGLGDWCMALQYIFWTINCIYGWKQWKPN